MARTFTAADARRLREAHQNLRRCMQTVVDSAPAMQEQIRKASDAVIAWEVMEILKGIPVDELNRDKRGLRVKSLRDSGYHTYADLCGVPAYTLEKVNGISEDGALTIKVMVKKAMDQAAEGVKVRISTDRRNVASTGLVCALSQYRNSVEHLEVCRRLLLVEEEQVEAALADLEPAAHSVGWLFTSRAKKQRAEEAYRRLDALLDEDYGKRARSALEAMDCILTAEPEAAWEDFAENPIPFFNTLESINPGVLGTDDGIYGLPETLAAEIQEEAFYPNGLLCELRRYQEWGVKYVLHQGKVLLGDEMGLGKTVQAIAAMVSLTNTGATHFIVVCPASVITNWCREIGKMSRLSVTRIHGSGRSAALASWLRTGGVAVTTFETTGTFRLPEEFRYTMLVVDEAHYIKNTAAQRTRNVIRLSEKADRMLFMTGTALENRVDEMVSLISILQPEVAFAVRGMEALSSAPRFRELVAPVYYRRRRQDVLTELPEKEELQEWCTLGPEEEAKYERAVLGRNYMDARRVSWSVDDLTQSCKAQRLLEIVEEAAAEGRKIIVFSFFLETIGKVKTLLGDRCLPPINGSVSPARRQQIIDDFDRAPAGSVLAAQIQSGGTGLNIQSASVVILCEPQFKPSIENQAVSRAYRMGQTRNVLVYRLLCEDTVDEHIMDILESKQDLFNAFADESTAAEGSRELDDRTFGQIIDEEIERIRNKNREMDPEHENQPGEEE